MLTFEKEKPGTAETNSIAEGHGDSLGLGSSEFTPMVLMTVDKSLLQYYGDVVGKLI